MNITMDICKKRFAKLWFICGGLIFVIVVLQSIFGKYTDRSNEVWEWFLPTIIPSLSLILGVLVIDSKSQTHAKIKVDKFLFNLSFYLSLSYLLLVSLTILLSPFVESIITPIDLMKKSNLWLAPFQGLVSGSLGAFFYYNKQ